MNKWKMMFTEGEPLVDQDIVGAYLLASSGVIPTSTVVGTKTGLDVNILNDLTVDINGIYDSSTNPTPDNVGLIGSTRSATLGHSTQVERITTGPLSATIVDENVNAIDAASHLYAYNGADMERLNSNLNSLFVGGNVSDGTADAGYPVKIGARAVSTLSSTTNNNRVNVVTDLYRRVRSTNSAGIGALSSSGTATNTASDIVTTPLAGRQYVIVQNVGTRSIFLGGSGVTASDGIEIPKGGSSPMIAADENVTLQVITSTGTCAFRVLELA